ncbi:MAG: GLPGLI family protein [Flavobacteriales bacterium]|jgi:GLPGLI family protein
MKATYLMTNILMLLMLLSASAVGQETVGKIVFEKRMNVHKQFPRSKQWIKEKDKIITTDYALYFNDSLSIFKAVPVEVAEQSWFVSKNIIRRNYTTAMVYNQKDLSGDYLHIYDTLPKHTWKMTNSVRDIAGYSCRKVFCHVNDSLTIYAWYTDKIVPSIGPETFGDLPGAILGLASEDGAVIYFAKSVEFTKPDDKEFEVKMSKKVKTVEEAKSDLATMMSRSRWWSGSADQYFVW